MLAFSLKRLLSHKKAPCYRKHIKAERFTKMINHNCSCILLKLLNNAVTNTENTRINIVLCCHFLCLNEDVSLISSSKEIIRFFESAKSDTETLFLSLVC